MSPTTEVELKIVAAPDATPPTPTRDPRLAPEFLASLVERLRAAAAAMGDEATCENTDRAKDAFRTRKTALTRALQGLQFTAIRDKKRNQQAPFVEAETQLVRVRATVEDEIASAPDHRLIPDTRERNQEWGRQQDLAASIRALDHGVEFFSGSPALPNRLRALLTTCCDKCGHEELRWLGPLPDVRHEIAKLQTIIDQQEAVLLQHVRAAESLLADTTK